jgi:hypothetical protein
VDALFHGPRRIAVEVKLTEADFSRCSRPGLTAKKPNFLRDHCDGSYTCQRGRAHRCSLAERGIRYWDFVPRLLNWDVEQDMRPCPLAASYQLVRNVLAACVNSSGSLDTESGHALVIYDARNPAFQPGGTADSQWLATLAALQQPSVLRRVSWQAVVGHLSQNADLQWLTRGLRDKYGLGAT